MADRAVFFHSVQTFCNATVSMKTANIVKILPKLKI